MPSITIVTPVWNGLPYIRECVESVISQDFTDWEFIIGDNCSIDGTREYLDGLSDPRIRIFKQERNLGIYGNLNFLFRHPRSMHVHVLGADDTVLPGGLGRIWKAWRDLPDEVGLIRFNWGGERSAATLGRYSFEVLPEIIAPEDSDLAYLLFGCLPGNLSNVSVKASLVLEAGGFREDLPYAGDFEMWSRMGRRWPLALSVDEVTAVRRHEGVASNYLNRKGELFPQLVSIYTTFVENLSPRISRARLIAFFNVELVSSHLRTALLGVSRGNSAYLQRLIQARSPILWSLPLRLFGCLPFALWPSGRQQLSTKMAKKLANFRSNR